MYEKNFTPLKRLHLGLTIHNMIHPISYKTLINIPLSSKDFPVFSRDLFVLSRTDSLVGCLHCFYFSSFQMGQNRSHFTSPPAVVCSAFLHFLSTVEGTK